MLWVAREVRCVFSWHLIVSACLYSGRWMVQLYPNDHKSASAYHLMRLHLPQPRDLHKVRRHTYFEVLASFSSCSWWTLISSLFSPVTDLYSELWTPLVVLHALMYKSVYMCVFLADHAAGSLVSFLNHNTMFIRLLGRTQNYNICNVIHLLCCALWHSGVAQSWFLGGHFLFTTSQQAKKTDQNQKKTLVWNCK